MDFLNQITNKSLIICDNSIKNKILEELNKKEKLFNIKFMSLNEFLNNYFFSYSNEMIYYIKNKYHVDLTIHVDPVDIDNEELNEIRKVFDNELPSDISYHDLRIANCNSKPVIEADIAVNFKEDFDINQFRENIKLKLKEINIEYDIDLSLDRK